jgi:hypothetical protein
VRPLVGQDALEEHGKDSVAARSHAVNRKGAAAGSSEVRGRRAEE